MKQRLKVENATAVRTSFTSSSFNVYKETEISYIKNTFTLEKSNRLATEVQNK